MNYRKYILLILLFLSVLKGWAQSSAKLTLFSDELKTAYPSVVYDFLERYLGEIQRSTSGVTLTQRMQDDKVTVFGGKLSNIKKITPETPFSMSLIEDKYYDVSWSDTLGNVLLDIAFPINFELLLGKSKYEIEKSMKDYLLECNDFVQEGLNANLEKMADGFYRTVPSSFYYAESVNTSSYYSLLQSQEYEPIYSDTLAWYSAANLFQGRIANSENYRLYIQQNMYGQSKDNYSVSLNQWLDYCRKNKMTIYFTIEEEHEDGLKALLIAQSKSLGFNHMMTLIIPDNFVSKNNAIIKATLNAFIPTQNVKDLYQQYTRTKRKKI